jgi:phosphoenolpyruvate synthase/pyruvate phosphate dikinase
VNYLKNNKLPDKKILQKRIEGYVFAMIDGKNKLYSGKEWIDKFEVLIGLKSNGLTKMIKGRVACLGKAQGKVKIVFSKKEIIKVNKGDILVTNMTSPDYVMAMRKASAIVTDEGGVTCHAAIVSRELGVPCIVGTGNATQILKDGDLVKVDANKGIVEKIQ